MIFKLSLTGIKSRFKDYMVLFSGLIVASMIFYMFMTLAANNEFLSSDVMGLKVNLTGFIFDFGAVLLAIITLVYIIYANNFLLSMRQKDYGMYMMLGAKSSIVGRLIFLETLITGLLATIVGIAFGFGLSEGVAFLLTNQLSLNISHFQPILPSAILYTVGFFVVLFLLAAIWNRIKLTRTPLISLIRTTNTPVVIRNNPVWKVIEIILGIGLLAVGYWSMAHYRHFNNLTIPIALFTIIFGTYFTFDSIFTTIISLLSRNHDFIYHGIRLFTLGQLRFRLNGYTRILATIAMLFALALGAITVGLGFNNSRDDSLQNSNNYYDDIILVNNPKIKRELNKVNITEQVTYSYKRSGKYNYFEAEQFNKKPLKYRVLDFKDGKTDRKIITLDSKAITKNVTYQDYLNTNALSNGEQKIRLVSHQDFVKIKAPMNTVKFVKIANFKQNYQILRKVNELQMKANPSAALAVTSTQVSGYSLVNSVMSGFEFMGFFLGLAFLTMLASTLMFKVLSGATDDRKRYIMLNKLGARKAVLKKSIYQEILVLFILPAAMGVMHVLFGLQLFKSLLPNPYVGWWLAFAIFGILYLLYYLLTVWLYQNIVLKSK